MDTDQLQICEPSPATLQADMRLFLILLCWLENPWKSLIASGVSYFQHSLKLWTLILAWTSVCLLWNQLRHVISSIHWHVQRSSRHLHPRYHETYFECHCSWTLWWFLGQVVAGAWWRSEADTQCAYFVMWSKDPVFALGHYQGHGGPRMLDSWMPDLFSLITNQ
jgi:hypothetical protein